MENEADMTEESISQNINVHPYVPSDALTRFDAKQAQHSCWVKNVVFGRNSLSM